MLNSLITQSSLTTMTLLPLLMLIIGIPASVFACIQIYKALTTPTPAIAGAEPISYKKTKALTWTTEVKVIEKK
jgi:hypothetical protein